MNIISRPEFKAKDKVSKQEYVMRVSARIRGKEICDYLGWDYNPVKVERPCIWIKPRSLKRVLDGEYVDVIDGIHLIDELKARPKVKVIAMSEHHYEYLKGRLKNEIVLIPHHHINFERQIHIRNEKLVGGFIGSPSRIAWDKYHEIKEALAKVDIDFTNSFFFQTREDMIAYYLSIDFLVIWHFTDPHEWYRHPTKIINAASFGIPTLARPIDGYKEMEGYYIPIENVEEIVEEATNFTDRGKWLRDKAEEYHISKIAELYKKL